MRFASVRHKSEEALCVLSGSGELTGLLASDDSYCGDLLSLVKKGRSALDEAARILASGRAFDPEEVAWLPPIGNAEKIICVGLNYADHAKESGFQPPSYPTLFGRFNSSLIGHGADLLKPKVSDAFDYEAEMVAVIGKGGRNIAKADALDHVVGYSVFNDVSVRDYQMKTPQWTIGKNFDGTGAFGPVLVTAEELPPGGAGLHIEARLNGEVLQSASTGDMIFDVAELVVILSEAMTLVPGDVIVTGTPSGVGMARTPPVWMKDGDVCEIEIEGVGLLRNRVVAER